LSPNPADAAEEGQLLTDDESRAQDDYGEDAFTAGIGAEAIRMMLESLDLEEFATRLRRSFAETKSEA
jgi:DNA-directed RNA polymerase subunit beta'